MRLLAFSDLHRDPAAARAIVDASAAADLVVGAGDLATMGRGLADTLGILRALTVPTILVAGNHDHLDELRAACKDWEHGHVLHGTTARVLDLAFFGLGFEIASTDRGPWNSRISEAEAAIALESCPAGAILVTHAPPYGIADLQTDGRHDGSRAVRAVIEQKQPRLHLCGHIHHAWGTRGTIGGCPVHNLGPSANWFEV